MEDIEIKNNQICDTHLAELLVMILKQIKEHPFEKLLTITMPITHSVIRNYYFRLYGQDDLMQEASMVLVDAVEEFRVEEGMAFIYFYRKKLLNKMNMLVRRERASKRILDTEAYSLEESVTIIGEYIHGESCEMTQPESRTVVNDTYQKYLVQLSPFEERVFYLYLNGDAPKKIAADLGLEEIQVRNALYRCNIKLKTCLQQ